jgi:SAM-dependent methyltransferase
MLATDDRHWWFRGRRRIIRGELERLDLPANARLLDAGCGSGRTLDDLSRYGTAEGLELDPGAAEVARGRGHHVHTGRVEQLPWDDGAFDVVTCLDVLEHTPDDLLTLRELRRVTANNRYLLLTVPAYQMLWSTYDVECHHYRRYRLRDLRRVARSAGWSIERTTGFNTMLVLPAAAVRLGPLSRALSRRKPASDLELTSPALDGLLELPLRLEATVLRRGWRFPGGLSLLAVLRNGP